MQWIDSYDRIRTGDPIQCPSCFRTPLTAPLWRRKVINCITKIYSDYPRLQPPFETLNNAALRWYTRPCWYSKSNKNSKRLSSELSSNVQEARHNRPFKKHAQRWQMTKPRMRPTAPKHVSPFEVDKQCAFHMFMWQCDSPVWWNGAS